MTKPRDKGPSPTRRVGQAGADPDRTAEPSTPATLLAKALDGKDDGGITQALASHLQGSSYSVTDFFRDAASIRQQRAAAAGTSLKQLLKMSTQLDRTMGASLTLASTAFETFIQNTLHAFCEFDENGIIVYANSKMRQLLPGCIGRDLFKYLGDLSGQARKKLSSGPRRLQQLNLIDGARRHPVLAEFGTFASDGRRGGFAFLIDMQDSVEAEQRALEAAPYGMLKVDADHRVVYANHNWLNLLELDREEVIGRDSRDFLKDKQSVEVATRQFDERREGRGGEYELNLAKAKSGTTTRLRVMSYPSYDASNRFCGMLASVVPIDYELARSDIARLAAIETDYRKLFDELIEIVRRLIPFDWADLTVFTADRDFALSICRYPKKAREYGIRWFRIEPQHRSWVEQPNTIIDDLAGFYRATLTEQQLREILEGDSEVKRVIEEGRKGLIGLPVRGKGGIVGVLSLQSHRASEYTPATMEILRKRLALEPPLQAIFIARQQAEDRFISELMGKVAKATDLKELAEIIVTEIGDFYEFQNVSIFKVNVVRGYFSLLAQHVETERGTEIANDYTQPIEEGLLGLTYQRQNYVNLRDRNDGSEEAKAFKVITQETESELCIPIKLRDRVLWILNIEDDRKSAFNKPEIETLERVVSQINASIDHLFGGWALAQVLRMVPDGVIISTKNGDILLGNDSVKETFGLNDLRDLNLKEFLAEPDLKIALSEQNAPAWKTTIVGADKKKRPVLLSKLLLEEEYDHVLLVLKNVSELQWDVDLQRLKAALAEATSQVRVPLSLVASFVQQIDSMQDDADTKDLARRALQQLSRVELTYDRIFASYDANKLPRERKISVELDRLLRRILDELPESDRKVIAWKPGEVLTTVSADPYRLLFALESMLTYLLRSRANASEITIEVSRSGNKTVQVIMAGPVTRTELNGEFERIVEDTRMEVALSEQLLNKIAAECGGSFTRQWQKHGREQLTFSLRQSTQPRAGAGE